MAASCAPSESRTRSLPIPASACALLAQPSDQEVDGSPLAGRREHRERAEQLFAAFDAADAEEEASGAEESGAKDDVLTQLTEMVGAELLTAVMHALQIGHEGAA